MLSGLGSYCKTCANSATRAWRKTDGGIRTEAAKAIQKTYGDPAEYAAKHCLHVADYIRRAIDRFESKTHQEAPPHLTAILSIADDMAARAKDVQARNPGNIRLRCSLCNLTFWTYRKDTRFCSKACRERAQYLRNLERDPDMNRKKWQRKKAKASSVRLDV